MATLNIAIIGECMVELQRREQDIRQGFGGDTLNTAVYLARQLAADQGKVFYVSALGTDHFSQSMIDAWQSERIDTSLVQRLPHKMPGLYFIDTDAQGERSFSYWRSDAAAKYWLETEQTNQVLEQLSHMDVLYLSGISLAILNPASRQRLFQFLASFRAQGGRVVFDNNYRPRLWLSREETQQCYQQMLQLTDIAFLTLDDEDALWGKCALETVIHRTQDLGVREIVIKRGAEPCVIVSQNGVQETVAAQKIAASAVIDTTAAGDSFSAGYLARRLQHGSVTASAEQGHRLAGTVIQYRGAIIPADAMPSVVL
ncbi:sugar kinase [Tolumonas lignilytica]|uniref:sugar kinase n=1 Tax=Tolumonas lignilytica TaxID=1283284 RepID=UPI000464CAAD|nr:sugar kinase [Tolumonas lignilytica]